MPLLMLRALYTRPDPPPPIILPIFHFYMPLSLLTKLSSTIPCFLFYSSSGTLYIIDIPSFPFALSFKISVFISSSDSSRTESTLGSRSLSGAWEELNLSWWLDLKLLSMLPCIYRPNWLYNYLLACARCHPYGQSRRDPNRRLCSTISLLHLGNDPQLIMWHLMESMQCKLWRSVRIHAPIILLTISIKMWFQLKIDVSFVRNRY